MRKALLWLGLLLALGIPNLLIARQERLLQEAVTVYLELAPADPRSLMQGDYMRLNYKLLREGVPGPEVRLRLDSSRVAVALETGGDGPPLRLAQGSWAQWTIPGAENYFFEEGTGKIFSGARYAEIKLTPDGNAMLTGLRGPGLQRL